MEHSVLQTNKIGKNHFDEGVNEIVVYHLDHLGSLKMVLKKVSGADRTLNSKYPSFDFVMS
jgi:hypothetical protein